MTDVVADAYATMAQFRAFVRNDATDDATDDDTVEELLALEAAARAIETSTARRFNEPGMSATARVYTAHRHKSFGPFGIDWWQYAVQVDDFFDTMDLEVRFDSTGTGDFGDPITTFRPTPLNSPAIGLPFTSILFDRGTAIPYHENGVEVTAKWGWTTTPNTIVNANLVQASRFLKRRDSPFGIAGSPDMGNELRLQARLDPDVAVMLAGFRRYF